MQHFLQRSVHFGSLLFSLLELLLSLLMLLGDLRATVAHTFDAVSRTVIAGGITGLRPVLI